MEESRGQLPSRSKSERKAILSKEVRRVIDEVEETVERGGGLQYFSHHF